MTIPAQRIQGSKTVADVERQTNIALERINGQIASAGSTGGVGEAAIAALQAQIDNLKILSGGSATDGGTGTPTPSPGDGTVTTDGVTITGDGVNFPISLIEPVVFSVRSTSTSPDAVTATDVFVLASASAGADIVENLPAATGTGRIIIFKKQDANAHNVAVTPNGTDTIDGVNNATKSTITIQYDVVRVVDGAAGAWSIW